MNEFQKEVAGRIAANGLDRVMIEAGQEFIRATTLTKYSYNFSWMGRVAGRLLQN